MSRHSRFGTAPETRRTYTPTVSRQLIEDPDLSVSGERPSWESLQTVSRLPLEPPPDLESSAPVNAMVPIEHPLWLEACRLLASDQRNAAADKLEQLCLQQPHHERGRAALLRTCIMVGRYERVGVHLAWMLRGQLRTGRLADAFATYQHVRTVLPSLVLSEVVLGAVLNAADAAPNAQVVLDATDMLLKHHGNSEHLPTALLLCAKHQCMTGVTRAGARTLQHLVANYPGHAAAEAARRKLAELGR